MNRPSVVALGRVLALGAAALLQACSHVPDKAYHPVCGYEHGRPKGDCSVTSRRSFVKEIPYVGIKADGWRTPRIDDLEGLASSPSPFDLGFLEYDDQGTRWDGHDRAQQLTAIVDFLSRVSKPVYLVVYVHGWHNNAREDWSDSGNDLIAFEKLLAKRVDEVRRLGLPHRVVGVFVGWRGEVWSSALNTLTIGDRSQAADRLALGRDFRGDLRSLASALDGRPCQGAHCDRMLVLGHSLGGRILTTAFAPDLAAGVVHPLGDKAVIATLEPAVSASIFDSVFNPINLRPAEGAPSWINLTSEDDWTTSWLFSIAATLGRPLLFGQGVAGDSGTERDYQGLGHYRPYITHQLTVKSYEDEGVDGEIRHSIDCKIGEQGCVPMCLSIPAGCGVPRDLDGLAEISLRTRWYAVAPDTDRKISVLWYNYANHCGGAFYRIDLQTTRKPFRADIPHGKVWNVLMDRSLLDGQSTSPFSVPEHNAFVQTNLGRMLDEIALLNLGEKESAVQVGGAAGPKACRR